MTDLYNIYGNYVSNKTVETFSDEVDYSDKIKELSKQIEAGDIKEEEMRNEIFKLKKLYEEGKFTDSDEKEFKHLLKKNIRLSDGLTLKGNLQLGGIIKASGFHLTDGTQVKTVTKYKDKLAVPLDKDGNISIQPKAGKKVNIGKTNMKELNIPKSGRITFGAGEDNDPYHLQKVGIADKNYLRLTLNDNKDESFQIWGNSCKGDKCKPDGGSVAHVFDSDGNVVHHGSLKIQNSKNKDNPTGYSTHFNYKKEGKNYIRGNTVVDGTLCVKENDKKKPICVDSNLLNSTKTMNVKGNANVKGDLVFNGGNNWIMHTPDDKRHELYIAPSKTKGKGDWNWSKQTRFLSNGEVILNEGKHSKHNRTGWATHFNHKGQGLNYIRGQTEMRGEVNFVDKERGINISNAKNGNNPTGWGTHFNYQGKALNYIRGKTEMRGETNFVDKGKGVNIAVAKNGNNPTGWGTHFNYQGKGLNYIRGKTEMRGEVNFVDGTKTINITNGRSKYNPRGHRTHLNYQGKGLNYLRGQTEIRGPELNVITNNGIRVHSKGRVANFGSQNSSWCHLITNAPQFYMNKSLQINGGVSSYHNKPLKLTHGAEVEKSLCLKTGNKKLCIDANGLGKIFNDLKMLKKEVNYFKNQNSVKFGDVVRIVSSDVDGILGSCGYDYVCRRNYAVQIFRRDANYLRSKAWTTFRIVPLHGRRDTGYLKYGQPFRIQMIAGSSFLTTCGYAPRCSQSFVKVSICKNNHPDSRRPVSQWKILGNGKSGNVKYSDIFKLRNNWSSGSFMNVCGGARGCGDNKIRDVNTTRINSNDYNSSTTNWKFEIEK